MGWLLIPNNRLWEYDNAPADPGANSPYRPLWLKQTAGVRTNSDGQKVFTKVRKVGSTVDTMGEIAKTYWDVKGDDLKFQMEVLIPSGGATFTIPCQDDGTFNAIIDWGDPNDTANSEIDAYNHADLAHTYAAGTYTIKISGSFPNIHFNNSGSTSTPPDGDRLLVTKVLNLGHVGWTTFLQAFFGCANLTEFSAGASDTSSVTNFAAALTSCTGLTTPEVGIDTSSATRFDQFFNGDNAMTDAPGIQNWDITQLTASPANNLYLFMIAPTKMSTATYDALLIAWAAQAPADLGSVKFGASKFTAGGEAEAAKAVLVNTYGWTITDGGAV
jgi:hypothetical protein